MYTKSVSSLLSLYTRQTSELVGWDPGKTAEILACQDQNIPYISIFEHTAQIFQIFKKVGVKLYHIFI